MIEEHFLADNASQEHDASIPPAGEIGKNSGNKFLFAAERCAGIETASIKYFNLVPNYQKLSIFSMATVATVDGKIHYLIDGQHHFEAALRDGQTTIICRILTIPDDSDTVLAWAKSYVRTGAIDADASYAENGRNILINSDLLLKDGFIRITPGGTWSPEQLKLNVVHKLASIFKRSKRTIENYQRHLDFLNMALIERAVREEVPKTFFSAIESAKAKFIDSVASLHNETTLIEVVSAQVGEWLDKFDRKTGKVSSLAKSNSKKNTNKPGTKAGADSDENKNSAIPEVMESEKQTNSSATSNSGEGIKKLFETGSVNGGEEDKKENEAENKEPEPFSGAPKFDVIQGLGKLLEADPSNQPGNKVDQIYITLNNLADDIKSIVNRRPSLALLAKELQRIFETVLDLEVTVGNVIEAEPYKKLEKDAA